MKQAGIVSSGPVDALARDLLRPYGPLSIAPGGAPEDLIPLLEGAVGLILRGDAVADRRVIEAGKRLRVIGRTGVGYDSVDLEAATEQGIAVVTTPGANADAVAEGAMTLLLALNKRLLYWDRRLKAGDWDSRYSSRPGDLAGKKLGIVGFGHTGRALAEMAKAFQMEILITDPYVTQDPHSGPEASFLELEPLLRQSDFVSLHASLTPETEDLIDRETASWMKSGAVLVNLARGGLIESLDLLYDALLEGRLAGVGLDVFDPEPPDVSHPIFQLENCLTAPHALGMTEDAMSRIFSSMARDMVAVLEGRRPQHLVNPEALETTGSDASGAKSK